MFPELAPGQDLEKMLQIQGSLGGKAGSPLCACTPFPRPPLAGTQGTEGELGTAPAAGEERPGLRDPGRWHHRSEG